MIRKMRWAWLCVLAACRIRFDELADATDDPLPDARVPACPIELQLAHDTSCARVGRNVKCWGRTGDGQLGTGSVVFDHVPKSIAPGFGERVLELGGRFSCGVDDAGAVQCVGWARNGELGDNTGTDRTTLGPVSFPLPVIALAGGARHMCAELSDNSVSCWGCRTYDPTALSSANRCPTALAVPFQTTTRGIPLESNHQVCHLDGDTVYCQGDNTFGQLGDGTQTPSTVYVAAQVDRVIAYGAGREHACALRDDGTVWCWGHNGSGQLGDATMIDHFAPAPVLEITDAIDLAVGGYHNCVRDARGVVKCWGSNGMAQIGIAGGAVLTPVEYPAPPAIDVAAGSFATCVADYDGMVWCSGHNSAGQAGQPMSATMNVLTPTATQFRCP